MDMEIIAKHASELSFQRTTARKCSHVKKNVRSAMLHRNLDKEFASLAGQRAVVATAIVNGLIKTGVQRHAHNAIQILR